MMALISKWPIPAGSSPVATTSSRVIEALGWASRYLPRRPTPPPRPVAAPHQFLFNRDHWRGGRAEPAGGCSSATACAVIPSWLQETAREVGEPAVVIDDLQPAPDRQGRRGTRAGRGRASTGHAGAASARRGCSDWQGPGPCATTDPRLATGAGGSPTVAGADSASAQLIALAGGVNIGTEAGVKNHSQLSNEGGCRSARGDPGDRA